MAASPDPRRYVRLLPASKERTVKQFVIQDPDTGQFRTFRMSDPEPWKLVSKGFADLLEIQTVRPHQAGSPRIFLVCDSDEKARYDAQEKAEWLSKAKKNRPDLRKHEDWTVNAPSDPLSKHGIPEADLAPPMTETDELKSVLIEQQDQISELRNMVAALVSNPSQPDAPPVAEESEPLDIPTHKESSEPTSREALLGLESPTESEPEMAPKFSRDEDDTDDLTVISGIGSAMSEHLANVGIVTYDKLAEQDAALLAKQLGHLQSMGARRTEKWIWAAQRLIGQR